MGALSDVGFDDAPRERRIGPPIVLTYERWHYRMPPNPPQWSQMGPNERAEWESARTLVDEAYWVNLW